MDQFKIAMYNTEGVGTEIEEQYLREAGLLDRFRLVRLDGDCDETFLSEASDADGVIIVYLNMTKANFERLKKCQVMTLHAIGVNNIDQKAASELGICVGNVPAYCIEEVAVHTVGMILDGVRRLSEFDRKVRQGKWPDVTACGKLHRTTGKTHGFVSFGNIPRRITELLKPFGLKMAAYDPYTSDDVFEKYGVERVDTIEGLFSKSDYISVHTPLLPSTRHMVSKKQFDSVKPGAVFVVTGRGGVVDEEALREAILNGLIVYAGIDVVEQEVSGDSSYNISPLIGLEQVVMTPHVAYYSEDSLVECRIQALQQVIEVLIEKKLPRYLVNKDVAGKARFQKNI